MSKNNTDKNEAGRTEPSQHVDTDLIEKKALKKLKKTADDLGIKYHHNVGLRKLNQQVNDFIDNLELSNARNANIQSNIRTKAPDPKPKKFAGRSEAEERSRLIKEATKLVRVRVTCMDPNMSEYEGKVFTAGNDIIPSQRKYVPLNGKPWHVPQIMLNMMKEEKAQLFKEVKVNGKPIKKGYMIDRYKIEELPPLTPKEIEDLAKEQAMANRIDD